MDSKTEELANSLFEKLKNLKSKKIKLDKDSFEKFIFELINNA